MTPDLSDLILRLLGEHRIMTIATNRSDGWPQATLVGYVNDGLILYCFVARTSQKYANIRRDNRVSLAIGGDFSDPLQIKGLSLAAKASVVDDRTEFNRIGDAFMKRCPEYAAWPRPDPALAPMLRMTPEIVSVLDYSKGFGHSDLIAISPRDLLPKKSGHSNWLESIEI